jgi:hypothetical protein
MPPTSPDPIRNHGAAPHAATAGAHQGGRPRSAATVTRLPCPPRPLTTSSTNGGSSEHLAHITDLRAGTTASKNRTDSALAQARADTVRTDLPAWSHAGLNMGRPVDLRGASTSAAGCR